MKDDDGFIKIIDDKDELLREALSNGGSLATAREGQMMINITGVSINTTARKDGRFQGYILREGQKKYFYGKSREEVAAKMKLFFQREVPTKKKREKKTIPTFGEYFEKWIALYKEPRLKVKSVLILRNTIKPALARFGNTPLDKITTDDLQEFLLSVKSTRSRDICRSSIDQIFRKALAQDLIKKNPCSAIELDRHVYGKKKALTREEEQRFLEAAQSSPHFLLFRFLLATGMRIGEALALYVSDFDTNSDTNSDGEFDTVSITKDVVFVDGQRLEQKAPKTSAGNRTIPIPHALCVAVLEGKETLVFPTTYNAVKCALDRISIQTGLKVTAHVLRHTYATRLEQAALPTKVRQYLLGHADGRMTENVYTDVQAEDISRAAKVIRELF